MREVMHKSKLNMPPLNMDLTTRAVLCRYVVPIQSHRIVHAVPQKAGTDTLRLQRMRAQIE